MTGFGEVLDQFMQDCGEGKDASAQKSGGAILVLALLITPLRAHSSIFLLGFSLTQSDRGRPA